jgi:hypothetical protein
MRKALAWTPVLALALVAPAGAAPNFLGPTGLLNTPTALTAPMASYDVYFHAGERFVSYGVNIGITPSIELGGTIFDPDNARSKGLVNAKYALTRDSLATPGIAVGVVDVADSIDTSVYVVLSKGFGQVALGGRGRFGLRAHAGYGTGMFDDTLFGGAELFFTDRLALLGEYDGRDVNFGASFRVGHGVQIKAGLFDADNFAAGISYSAGLR